MIQRARAFVLAGLVLASSALAETPATVIPSDKPMAIGVEEGQAVVLISDKPVLVLLPKGVYINEVGEKKLNQSLAIMQEQNIELTAENGALRTEIDKVAAQQASNLWLAVGLSLAAGFVAGGVAVGFVLLKK